MMLNFSTKICLLLRLVFLLKGVVKPKMIKLLYIFFVNSIAVVNVLLTEILLLRNKINRCRFSWFTMMLNSSRVSVLLKPFKKSVSFSLIFLLSDCVFINFAVYLCLLEVNRIVKG